MLLALPVIDMTLNSVWSEMKRLWLQHFSCFCNGAIMA